MVLGCLFSYFYFCSFVFLSGVYICLFMVAGTGGGDCNHSSYAGIVFELTCVTSLSALLVLSAQHGKTGRLRVQDTEPSLRAGKENDE